MCLILIVQSVILTGLEAHQESLESSKSVTAVRIQQEPPAIDGVLDDTVNFYNNSVGNGENITLFSKESLQRLLYVKGFEYEDYGTWTDEERKRVAFLKCRKVQKV